MKETKTLFALTAMLLFSTSLLAHDFLVDDIYYKITSSTEQTVSVTYKGNYYSSYSNEYSGTVSIPETVVYNGKTYKVTGIGEWGFGYCSNLKIVNIPNSITDIGGFAFCGCSGLTSVAIPHSVNRIGGSVFGYCTNLTSVTIGSGVESIGGSVFRDCTSLEVVECCTEKLPEIEDPQNQFNGTPRVKLYVAQSSIDKYKSASPWKEFEEILPIVRTVTYILDSKVYAVLSKTYTS